MDNKPVLRWKRIRYEGFHLPKHDGEVAYMIVGNNVLFTALIPYTKGATSSINAAEAIIHAICRAENIRWEDYTFFDAQTSLGYPHHESGYFCIDRLEIEPRDGEHIHVESWSPVAMSANHARERGMYPSEIPGLPRGLAEKFNELTSGRTEE